ncbi:MAG: carbohydrate ABC transporter substrate-binding protein [Clostridiales bacterium]|nr:carbohydrate ABC transporter substrate-binding protein [Clostridiales bacterium]
MKKLLSVIALMLVCVFLFAACGDSTQTTSDPVKTEDKKTEATDAPAVEEAKTIVYWSMWEPTEKQGIVIQKAVDAYMADTGNVVDVQFKGRTGQREGLQPALDGGMVIDLFDEDVDRVNGTWSAYLMDLEALSAANDYEATGNDALIAASRDAAGGTLMSIPYQPFVFAFAYNKDIFTEAGVTSSPKTWDEFLDACAKIKAAGYAPLTCDDAYMTAWYGYALARFVGQDGVTDVVTNGKWAEEPAVLKMAQQYEELATLGYISENLPSNVWPMGQNGEFALGEVGMYINGTWLPNEVNAIAGPDFKWGFFNYPAVPDGVDGVEAANFGAQCLAINKDSLVSEEAFEIIKYITKGEFDTMLANESMGIPVDSANAEWPVQLAEAKVVFENLTKRYSWAANAEANVDMTPLLKENFIKLCAGQMTAQEFVDAMEAGS